ncbi:MAG: hypothetical protein J0M15_05555 [Deltaproteobacteria bacterium]|jgi:hypothetical protein|nr:hypothetical protein [Deltaproteobacteria bacterium]
MGKNIKMKMTHKAKTPSGKNQKSNNSKHIGSKGSDKNKSKKMISKSAEKAGVKTFSKEMPKSSLKYNAPNKSHFKGAKKEVEFNKKYNKPELKGVDSKRTEFSKLPIKGHKKEIKIEVTSFKKEHLKKLELKKREHEKSLELKNKKLQEDQNKSKKFADKKEFDKKVFDKKITDKKHGASSKTVELSGEGSKSNKVEAKNQSQKELKKQKPQKTKDLKDNKETDALDDVFLDDDNGNEIEEYAEDLKAVEEADLEIDDSLLFEAEVKEKNFEEINLTDAEGNLLCRARDCDQVAGVDGYCRYHYLLYWKKIQVRKKILTDGKLERYVEELTSRYPDKFLEMIRRDLRTEKDFLSAIQELEIDESNLENEFEEDTQTFIDEVRGINEGASIDEEFE